MDKVDPNKDALGHLLFDAPQYLVAIVAAISVGTYLSSIIQNYNKNIIRKTGFQPNTEIVSCSAAGSMYYSIGNIVKGIMKTIECTKSI
jgi:hypothetical protein